MHTFSCTILKVYLLPQKGRCTIFVQSNTESCAKRKREGSKPLSPKKSLFIWVFLFPEVALEETGEGLAVPCLVAGHFVDGVVDGVEIQLLGALGEGGLAGGGTVLRLDPHLQILLGGVGDDLTQQLRELGGI